MCNLKVSNHSCQSNLMRMAGAILVMHAWLRITDCSLQVTSSSPTCRPCWVSTSSTTSTQLPWSGPSTGRQRGLWPSTTLRGMWVKSGEYSHISIAQDPDDLPFIKGEVLVVLAKVILFLDILVLPSCALNYCQGEVIESLFWPLSHISWTS